MMDAVASAGGFDAIRERIVAARQRNATSGGGLAVVLTSPASGEGVTTVTVGLACSFARMPGCRTLVIDDGGETPGVAGHLRLAPRGGGPARGEASGSALAAVQRSPEHGIDVLVLDPDDVRRSHGAAAAIADLRAAYEVVLIDAGSLQTHRPLAWSEQADETILVIDTERTTVEALERLRSDLAHAGRSLTGVILNKRRLPVPEALYRRFR